MEQPWEWRRASGGWGHPNDPHNRLFHAYDVNSCSACVIHLGLGASCEEPNEGSALCAECVEVIKAMPAGRAKRFDVA